MCYKITVKRALWKIAIRVLKNIKLLVYLFIFFVECEKNMNQILDETLSLELDELCSLKHILLQIIVIDV